jgi:hypothetical protein
MLFYGRNLMPKIFTDITMLAKLFIAQILAPIKRPLSIENTSPSQKIMSFFAGSVSSLE